MSNDDVLAKIEDTEITRVESSSLAVLSRSEAEMQIDAAHKYPRSVKKFLNESLTLATLTRDVAESCIYTLPRAEKPITGPSVRLAEIMASAYGNLHVATRVIGVEENEIVAQGICWDTQVNLRVCVEVRRRIVGKGGKRYNLDMQNVTGAAAASIALRNAIFRVVPRAYVDVVYAKVKEVAVGNAMTLATRRVEVVARLGKMGVPQERVFALLGKPSIEDVGLDDVEVLIGLGTAIKGGDKSIDEAFPPVAGTTTATKTLEEAIKAKPVHKHAEDVRSAHDADGVITSPQEGVPVTSAFTHPSEAASAADAQAAEAATKDESHLGPLPMPPWLTNPADTSTMPAVPPTTKATPAAKKRMREPGDD